MVEAETDRELQWKALFLSNTHLLKDTDAVPLLDQLHSANNAEINEKKNETS